MSPRLLPVFVLAALVPGCRASVDALPDSRPAENIQLLQSDEGDSSSEDDAESGEEALPILAEGPSVEMLEELETVDGSGADGARLAPLPESRTVPPQGVRSVAETLAAVDTLGTEVSVHGTLQSIGPDWVLIGAATDLLWVKVGSDLGMPSEGQLGGRLLVRGMYEEALGNGSSNVSSRILATSLAVVGQD